MLSLLVFLNAFRKCNVFLVVRVRGESELFRNVLATVFHHFRISAVDDIERIVERSLVGIPCRQEECVALGVHFLIVSTTRSKLVEPLIKLNAITLGRAVADGIDGSGSFT